MDHHGTATWAAISRDIGNEPACHRLKSYWHFDGCRFDKGSMTCSEPDLIDGCPLPRHRLRNGRLNQTAYCFFLFVRDIADGDIIGWIDRRVAGPAVNSAGKPEPIWKAQERLIGPLRNVYGVSDKILTMALSGLLLSAEKVRPGWFEVGAGMIVVDTLVHNFLHRTGILEECGTSHPYGAGCYGEGGCAEILGVVSGRIDATAFNKHFPAIFDRFVQHAIWRYCAGDGLNTCNGNRIDDRSSCAVNYCQISNKCRKKALKPVV